ncbi:hypothetical protein BAUCODRAFT_124286 [Baudoinia panamericana UAMH 10762]|uniref:Uncharacterized protein n=1 Tax=Baudoinia panamericana (strain UAMH 10762) TaxID=717646 RepID=M2N7B2_BAUPA|nr:uncharacterized protein BAUCODRAFT_124286 [Baudoinia panamericana UAMH 10762]EMC94685.1 hypothetical protein BAUCODRAFT_124286 [Baudoinia panamericana UAMH 10762]
MRSPMLTVPGSPRMAARIEEATRRRRLLNAALSVADSTTTANNATQRLRRHRSAFGTQTWSDRRARSQYLEFKENIAQMVETHAISSVLSLQPPGSSDCGVPLNVVCAGSRLTGEPSTSLISINRGSRIVWSC